MILFAATLLTGITQLICMIGLQRVLAPEVFSQVSLVLGFFTFYIIFVDLGLQSDLVRRMASAAESQAQVHSNSGSAESLNAAGVTGLRFLGALAGFACAGVSVLLNQSSHSLLIALMLMMVSLFPLGSLLTIEASSLAKRELGGALRVRLGKLIGILFITAYFATVGRTDTSLTDFVVTFGAYSCIQAALVWTSKTKKLTFNIRDTIAEFKNSWNLIGHRSLIAAVGVIFLNFQVSIHSETRLSEFNMAQSIIAPLSIIIQIVIGIAASRLFVTSERRLGKKQIIGIAAVVLVLHTAFASLFSVPYLIEKAFPGLSPSLFFIHLLPLTLHSFLALISSFQLLQLQHFGQKWTAILAGGAGLVVLILSYLYFRDHAQIYSSWMICISHLTSIVVAFVLGRNQKTTSP